ncbi:MAG TPA: 50S ribosomal protein L10 [Nitrososphaerales archaeon]|nr:50S ribosomal protein L10 [Nitrososphaerales archaeon]
MSKQQLVTSQEKRTSYPKKKEQELKTVQELASKYDTIIVSKLFKVRAGQLMLLRKNFRGELTMLVAKNKIAQLAFKNANIKNYDQFASKLDGQNALIFTNMNPFKLYLALEKSKVNLPARAGDVATNDIIVPAGNTGIPPGPVLSEFKEANVATRIESGSIYVSRDSVVARPGDTISPKLAGLLSRLNLKPIKAGMSIFMASSGGLLLLQKDITIDLDQYHADLTNAVREALGLAVEIAFPTPESLPFIIAKASRNAMEVAKESGYITPENAESVLGYAEAQAKTLLAIAKEKGFAGE